MGRNRTDTSPISKGKYGFKGTKESHRPAQDQALHGTQWCLLALWNPSQSLAGESSSEIPAALYRDRALSKVGLPDQNIEKYGLALPGLPLSLCDDVTQPVLVLTPYKVTLPAVTVRHYMIICKKERCSDM